MCRNTELSLLWRAGYSLDGYGTTIDRWIDGTAGDDELDYIPSSRIRQYLSGIRREGTIPELDKYGAEGFRRSLRLRAVRGLGPKKIAVAASLDSLDENWLEDVILNSGIDRNRVIDLFHDANPGPCAA